MNTVLELGPSKSIYERKEEPLVYIGAFFSMLADGFASFCMFHMSGAVKICSPLHLQSTLWSAGSRTQVKFVSCLCVVCETTLLPLIIKTWYAS